MIKIKDITSEFSQLTDKYDEKYIDGLVREQLAILDYKKTFQGELNEQDEEDEIELDPEELPVDKEEPIEKEPESQEEPEIETQPEEEPEPEIQGGEDGEIELEPEELPTPKPLPIVPTPKEDYETISRKQAQELLSYKGKIFTAVFSKREDGSLRAANGMIGVRKYVSGGELPYSPKEKNLIPFYDLKIGMGRKGYRMIPVEGLKTLNINGKKYKIDQNIKEIKINPPGKSIELFKSNQYSNYAYIFLNHARLYGEIVQNSIVWTEDTIDNFDDLKLLFDSKRIPYKTDGYLLAVEEKHFIIKKEINENMKKSELRQLVKEAILESNPQPQRVSPDRETITKPETDTPERKPKRRTLTPPTEAPNTKPKAEGVIKENEQQISDKIAQRYNNLKQPEQLDEAVGSLIIGGLLAAPKVLEWIGKATKFIVGKLGKDESQAAQNITKFAHKWEGFYVGSIEKVIKATGVAKSVWKNEDGSIDSDKLHTTAKVLYAVILAVAAGYAVNGVLSSNSAVIKAIESAIGGVKGVEIAQIASKIKSSL